YVSSGAQRLEAVTHLPGLAYGLQTIQEAHEGSTYIPPWTTLHYLFFKSRVFTGGVFLLDRTGRVMWTEPPGLVWLHQTFVDLTPIARVRETHESVIPGVLSPAQVLPRPHAIAAVPIRNESGELQGILGGVIDLTASELSVILTAVSTVAGRFVEIVDQNGIVAASTNAARQFLPFDAARVNGQVPILPSAGLTHAPWQVVAGRR